MHLVLLWLWILEGVFACDGETNGFSGEKMTSADQVELGVGWGWYPFTFTNAGSEGSRAFHFVTTTNTVLKVTDVYCPGDAFAVYDNGVLLGITPTVTAYCENRTPLAELGYPSSGWSSAYFYLPPGDHLITLIVTLSPWTAGGAYLKVDYNLS
ncbi:putative membrane protein [Paramicrosporidium saccamoebae]|uniref:Putative membrane protein n=1 Tax=Paramicrosporidium saccamoebae TaxID=1246581 RepID=A0A2H9TK97_9FUNG|nr:putative membrane protein [Paramicrosporidium saccamoebae]